MSKTFKFDPRALISEPFISCPFCGEQKYGILSVSFQSYARRCANCLKSGPHVPLPTLRKKIIYLDQNIISNMMKSINPDTNAHRRGKVETIWKEVFVQLDRVCKLQLVVCPDSDFHDEESSLCQLHQPLKDVYEHFSHGVTFESDAFIRSEQLAERALVWRGIRTARPPCVEAVTQGHIHGWQENLRVTVNYKPIPELTAATKAVRRQATDDFAALFKRWQAEKGLTFESQLATEMEGLRSAALGVGEHAVTIALKKAGEAPTKCAKLAAQFLREVDLKDIPTFNLLASIFAALAAKAATNVTMKPPRGVVTTDIMIIAHTLPYCAAIFVDDFFRALLTENPLRKALPADVKVFSSKTTNEFLAYLKDIELKADPGHIRRVEEIYGQGWKTSHENMFMRADSATCVDQKTR